MNRDSREARAHPPSSLMTSLDHNACAALGKLPNIPEPQFSFTVKMEAVMHPVENCFFGFPMQIVQGKTPKYIHADLNIVHMVTREYLSVVRGVRGQNGTCTARGPEHLEWG